MNDFDYTYLMVYDGGKLVAHTSVYSISCELDVFATGMAKQFVERVRGPYPGFLKIKFLECGSPVAIGNTLIYAPHTDRKQALQAILKAIDRIATSKRIHVILLRDFTEEEAGFHSPLLHGYKRVRNLPNAVMHVCWSSFDEYLDAMRSHYRYKMRKRTKKAADGGLKIELVHDFSHHSAKLQQLWMNVYRNAGEYRREILTREFFEGMSRHMKGVSKVLLARKDDQILGFALLLSEGKTLRFMYSGLDYQYNERFCVYSNLLTHIVRVAIDEGAEYIDLGITTLFPKLSLGAHIEPLYMYMKHRNPLLHPIVCKLFDAMTPQGDCQSLNVFKKDDSTPRTE